MATATLSPPHTLPPVDEEAVKARINDTLAKLDTNEEIAEFYCDLREHVALRRAQLETELLFEMNFLKAAESLFKRRLEVARAKRLPSSGYEITIETKQEKQYDAPTLRKSLEPIITKNELEEVAFLVETLKTNGTAINKLVRAYGPDSDVARIVSECTTVVEVGQPKLKIEKRK